jgi:hypothetical protein
VIDGLRLTGRDAVDLAVANQLNPSEKPLLLGALFVTGRYTRPTSKTPTRYCAPLLTASVTQEQDPTSATFTLAGDVGLNLALLADLLNTGEDEEEGLLHRLEGLLDFVPDLPFDPGDVAGFCEGLSTLLDLPVTVHHPVGLDPTIDLPEAHAEPRQGLELIGAAALSIGKDASELSVIRELEAIAEQDAEDSALAAVLDPQASTHTGDGTWDLDDDGRPLEPHTPEDWHDDIEPVELTDTQRKVVNRARSQPLTVVTGPPGTGKSYSICGVVLDHLLASRTVLVTSGTAKAIEVVADKLAELTGSFTVAVSGDRKSQRKLAKTIDELTSPQGAPTWYSAAQIAEAHARYARLRGEINDLEGRLIETLAEQGNYAFYTQSLDALADITERFDLAEVRKPVERLRALHDRASVSQSHGWLRQWRAKRALNTLRRQLGGSADADPDAVGLAVDVVAHRTELDRVTRAIESNPDLTAGWAVLEELRRQLFTTGAAVLVMQRQTALAQLLDDTAARTALRKFSSALKRAKHTAKKQLLEEVPADVLLRAFPCWASTDRFLSHILPLRPGLFGSLRFLEDPNLLNVAITRARERLVAVTSVTANQLPAGDTHYLRGFLEHAAAPFDPGEQPDRFDSDFERQVAEALRARGLRVISQYPSCGYSIDLVVTDGTNSLAVECDGPSHFDPEGKYVSDDVPRHYPGVHEPLVDAATFLKAQELLDARSVRGTRERKHHHYLKGLLHCGVCGRRLSCQHSKGRYLYFFCLGQKNDRTTTCREPYVPADRIEDEIARLYQRLQLPEGLIAEVRKEIDKEIARRQRGHAAERKRHSRELARLDAQRR